MATARLAIAGLGLLACLGQAEKQPKPVEKVVTCGTTATSEECTVTEPLEEFPGRLLSENAEELPLCPMDQYRKDENTVVLPCDGITLRVDMALSEGEELIVVDVPVGTHELFIDLNGDSDFDTHIIDMETGECIIGFACQPCGGGGCTDLDYEGTTITFSGDDFISPVKETTRISEATRPLRVTVIGYSAASGYIAVSLAGIDPCPEITPGCKACSSYPNCTASEEPVCDGTSVVLCAGAEESMPASETVALRAGAAAAADEGLRLFDGVSDAAGAERLADARPQAAPMLAAITAAALVSLAAGLFAAAAARRQGWMGRSGAPGSSLLQPRNSSAEEEEEERGRDQDQEHEDLLAQRVQP